MTAQTKIEAPPDFDLTSYMQANGILRICNTDIGFSVALKGNAWGSGKTVEEALHSARAHREKMEASHVCP